MEYKFREQFDSAALAPKPKPAPKRQKPKPEQDKVIGNPPNFLQGMPFSCSLYRPNYRI